jgi:pimeloyl-ACP methyl ester carboxylesterase
MKSSLVVGIQKIRRTASVLGLIVGATALLSACGGSSGTDAGNQPVPIVNKRGELLNGVLISSTDIATLNAGLTSNGLIQAAGGAKCNVAVYQLTYSTVGARNEDTTSTGVVLLPAGGPSCPTTPPPLLAYAHGTTTLRTFTMAGSGSETSLLSALYASQGYAVVASDYQGLGGSGLTYHPYLVADTSADAMADSIRGARALAAKFGAALSDKVFVTGYSQGGHVAMATARAIEAGKYSDISLTASAPLSGPYALVQTAVGGAKNPPAGSTINFTYIVTGYQKSYGGIYTKASDVFKAPYDATIERLIPGQDASALLTSGAIPSTVSELFQDSFLNDLAAGTATSPLVQRLTQNTLLGWNPKAPMVLCGGQRDPVVPFPNSVAAQADFKSRNINVALIDVDALVPVAAPLDQYHGTIVPPLCLLSVRSGLFDKLR